MVETPEPARAQGGLPREPSAERLPAAERLRRELARGTLELAVLACLGEQRRYGYELLERLRRAGEDLLGIKEGTLYPLLHRLEDAGLIDGTWEASGRARPRKYYALTEAGRAHLVSLRDEWNALVEGMGRLLANLERSEP